MRIGPLGAWAIAATAALLPLSATATGAPTGGLLLDGTHVTVLTATLRPEIAPAVPRLQHYKAVDQGFEVDVPAGWTVSKETGSSEIRLTRRDATLSIAADPLDGLDPAAAPGAMLASIAESLQAQCSPNTISRVEAGSLAGGEGRYFTSDCTAPGHKPTHGQFFAGVVGGRLVSWSAVFPTEDAAWVMPAGQWTLISLKAGSQPHERSRTADKLRAWTAFVKKACEAGVFSQIQCSAELADALGDEGRAAGR